MSDAEVEMIMRTLVESIQTYEQVVEVREPNSIGEIQLINIFVSSSLFCHNI